MSGEDFSIKVEIQAGVTGEEAVKRLTANFEKLFQTAKSSDTSAADAAKKAKEAMERAAKDASNLANGFAASFKGNVTAGLTEGIKKASASVALLTKDLKALYAAKATGNATKTLNDAIEITEAKVRRAATELARLKELSSSGVVGKVDSSGFSTMAMAMGVANVAAQALMSTLRSLKETTTEAVLASARYETLGVVMGVVGNNVGKTRAEMEQLSKSLQASGISMEESRQSLISIAQAHLGLENAAKLSRIAQDAAVIGNMNSSQAFSTMIYALQSAQVEMLRTIGINVNFESGYAATAKTLKKSVSQLTELEKTQSRVNQVLAKAPDIMGVYEASMQTAGKQLLSQKRYADDLKVAFGDLFGGAFEVGVLNMNTALIDMKKWLEANKVEAGLVRDNLESVTKDLAGIITDLLSMGSGLNNVADGLSIWAIAAKDLALVMGFIRDCINVTIGALRAGFIDPMVKAAHEADKLLNTLERITGLKAPDWIRWLTGNGLKDMDENAGWKQLKSGVALKRTREAYGSDEPLTMGEDPYQRTPYSQTERDRVKAAKRAEAERKALEEAKAAAEKAKEAAKLELEIVKAKIEAELAATKLGISASLSMLESGQDRELSSIQSYYAKRAELQSRDVQAEIKAKEKAMGLLTAGRRDEPQRIALQTQINALRAKEGGIIRENYRAAADLTRELSDKVRDLEDRLADLSGATAMDETAAADKIARAYDAMRAELVRKFGRDSEPALNLIDKMLPLEQAKAKFAVLQNQYSAALVVMQTKEQALSQKTGTGEMTSLESEQAILALHKDTSAMLDVLIAKMEEYAALFPELAPAIAQAKQEVSSLKSNVTESGAQMADAMERGLGDALFTVGQDFSDLGSAVESFGMTVLNTFGQIISKALAMSWIKSIFNGVGGGAGGWWSGVMSMFGMAKGGPVRGPGTSTSDSIPAWLSDGEYVLRASAVRRLGTGFLDFLNGLPSRPAYGFAEGGLATSIGSESIHSRQEFFHNINLGLDRGIIYEAMESDEGARISINHAKKNAKRFNSALGR